MEQERHIEQWLCAYAKKRRAGAGAAFALPSATRRRLQNEVARRAAEPEAEDSISLWELFRQQWAVLAGFALIMFIGASLVLPDLIKTKAEPRQRFKTVTANGVPAGFENNSPHLGPSMAAATKPLPVLATFEVQQNGDVITVVDDDGSVYTGAIEPEPPARNSVGPSPAPDAVANDPVARLAKNQVAVAQNVFFRVVGQNRTLKQTVVFVGNLFPPTNADMPTKLPPPLLSSSSIVGTVTLGDTPPVVINAVPVAP